MTEQTVPNRRVAGAERDLSPIYQRYGRGDIVTSVLGMLTALGTLVFLSALFAAGAANIELQMNLLNAQGVLDEVELVGAITAIIVVFVAFLLGGIAAGRMSRYSGGLNGMGAALWFLLLITVFAALGTWVGEEYNAFGLAGLPNWVSQVDVDDVTTEAIVLAIAAVVAMFVGGYLGGRIGELHHREIDAALVDQTLE